MSKNNIHNLRSLREARKELIGVVQSQESRMQVYADFFRDNYKGIIWSAVNPFKKDKPVSSATRLILNEIIPAILGTQAGSAAASFVAKGTGYAVLKMAARVVNKLAKTKKKKKKEKQAPDKPE
jgi:hypothetical protein